MTTEHHEDDPEVRFRMRLHFTSTKSHEELVIAAGLLFRACPEVDSADAQDARNCARCQQDLSLVCRNRVASNYGA